MMKKHKWLMIIIECIAMAALGAGILVLCDHVLERSDSEDSFRTAYSEEDKEQEDGAAEDVETGYRSYDEQSTELQGYQLPHPAGMNKTDKLSISIPMGEDSGEIGTAPDWSSLGLTAPDEDSEVVPPEHLIDPENYEDAPADNGNPYYIKVNRSQNVVTVYGLDEAGYYTVPLRAFVCSVGRNNGTPTGTFRTSDKHEWSVLVGGVYGQYAYRINGHIMFHSVPYYSRNKASLESEEYNKLGTAASLGCVRLAVKDVKWIYDNCPSGTIVTIYDSDYPGPLGKPVAEGLDLSDERAGWDPTDPDEENPWNTEGYRFLGCGDRILERGYAYDLLAGITVYDEQENDVTDRLHVETDCDPWTAGSYDATYQITGEDGTTTTVSRKVYVKDTIRPEIYIKQDYLTLNRIQASTANIEASIRSQIALWDAGMELSNSHVQLIYDAVTEEVAQTDITIVAIDDYGNYADQQAVLYIDWNPPLIEEPTEYKVSGDTEDEIRARLLDRIAVTDEESGVAEIKVTWTQHVSFRTYSVMVIAKDYYGNVSTSFFDGFRIEE